jgi:predicted transcriptional regulator
MTLETDSKIIAQQYLAKYGKAEAIKILEKLASLKNDEATAIKNQAAKFHSAAQIVGLLGLGDIEKI